MLQTDSRGSSQGRIEGLYGQDGIRVIWGKQTLRKKDGTTDKGIASSKKIIRKIT